MTQGNLLASAASLASLHAAITRFYCGTATRLEPTAPDAWRVIRVSDNRHLDGVTVRKARNRFRFEMVTP